MSELVQRLKKCADIDGDPRYAKMLRDAAAEVERLTKERGEAWEKWAAEKERADAAEKKAADRLRDLGTANVRGDLAEAEVARLTRERDEAVASEEKTHLEATLAAIEIKRLREAAPPAPDIEAVALIHYLNTRTT